MVLAVAVIATQGDAQGSCPLIVVDGVVQPPTSGPGEGFGVTAYQCASCGFKRDQNNVPEYSFSAEPIVLEVTPWSPLRTGDVIVAVNGHPITTRAGADQFTYPAQVTNEITVRRDGGQAKIRGVPRLQCVGAQHIDPNAIERVEVLRGAAAQTYGAAGSQGVVQIYRKAGKPPVRTIPPTPNAERADSLGIAAVHGKFGFAIACVPSCTKVRAYDGTEYWKYDGHPPIAGIRAGGPAAMSGIQLGDLVIKIDGISILVEEGALRFQRAERTESLHVTVLRNGKEIGYLLKAR